jgi:hypothetical protein
MRQGILPFSPLCAVRRALCAVSRAQVQTDQVTRVVSAVEQSVREHGERPARPFQDVGMRQLPVSLRRGSDEAQVAPLVQHDQVFTRRDQRTLAHWKTAPSFAPLSRRREESAGTTPFLRAGSPLDALKRPTVAAVEVTTEQNGVPEARS